jgi:glycosyltransferase involved in cell wall biosynthesis
MDLDSSSIVCLLWTDGNVPAFVPTVRSVRASHEDLEIIVGFRGEQPVLSPEFGVLLAQNDSLSMLVESASQHWTRSVLLINAPVIAPPGLLELALRAMQNDMRISTVSFLSNAAGYLSVPHRNHPISHQVGPHDEVSITRALRSDLPIGDVVSAPLPAGGITLLSHLALGAVDGLRDLPATPAFLVTDFALRAARRGFISVVDMSTYVTRAVDMLPYLAEPIDNTESIEREQLFSQHGFIREVYEDTKASAASAVALGVALASVKIRGLRVIIEASEIGPKEMGTQVQILSLVQELAERDDVGDVQVGLPGPIPAYAVPFLSSAKIRPFYAPDLDLSSAEGADVLHRPAQPSLSIPIDAWREKASRIVVTLQDLIAYQVGAYANDGAAWLRYRSGLADASSRCDGVVVISHDTLHHVRQERLPIEAGRLFVVENGTDHLTGAESSVMPGELSRRGVLGEEFLLALGTNYSHKNRDLAIRAWKLLRHSFPQLHLVLAGPFVPAGSSRLAESLADPQTDQQLHVLPDVDSAGRNWLLTHASAVVYPSSAEGFGLVPFEAARFGTPTAGVEFGPIAEVNPGVPVHAASWRPEDLAAAVGAFMSDPAIAAAQIRATLDNGAHLSWSRTAQGLVNAYRSVLAMAPRI